MAHNIYGTLYGSMSKENWMLVKDKLVEFEKLLVEVQDLMTFPFVDVLLCIVTTYYFD